MVASVLALTPTLSRGERAPRRATGPARARRSAGPTRRRNTSRTRRRTAPPPARTAAAPADRPTAAAESPATPRPIGPRTAALARSGPGRDPSGKSMISKTTVRRRFTRASLPRPLECTTTTSAAARAASRGYSPLAVNRTAGNLAANAAYSAFVSTGWSRTTAWKASWPAAARQKLSASRRRCSR